MDLYPTPLTAVKYCMIYKPLILLGTNSNILKLTELAARCGFIVHGIVDDDYYGAGSFKGIPVICQEQEIMTRMDHYRDLFQFICATNWVPDDYEIAQRNRDKRQWHLALLDHSGMDVAAIIAPSAIVSGTACIGAGTVIYDYAVVEPGVTVGPHCMIYDHATVGHDSTIGRNTVLQRYVGVTSLVDVQENTYLGIRSSVLRSDVTLGAGTFVHPNLMLLRGTQPGETVSLAGRDLRKVYAEAEVA